MVDFAIPLPRRGAGAFIVSAVGYSYLITLLPLWPTMSSYPFTTPVILAELIRPSRSSRIWMVQELGNLNGAGADPTEQELRNLGSVGADLIEQELGN
ncbi:hypothetical protein B296_00045808 [Ensete ventricosum]|uniref:Uncharacterized protein n=1 Tax=Ensete ventricosum TaxID=4639 RepID=A0A426XWP7_ENSVE|nr:hypothetical protein B296_00045808 [Ensete ventricosum]